VAWASPLKDPTPTDWLLSVEVALSFASSDLESQNVRTLTVVVIFLSPVSALDSSSCFVVKVEHPTKGSATTARINRFRMTFAFSFLKF